MLLEFTEPFGHHEPGELIELPDDAVFDRSYLREAPEGAELKPEEAGEEKPAVTPRYKTKKVA